MSVWKSDETLLSICILNFSFKNDFVWEEISIIRHSVSSPDETPRSLSKILRCASFFQLSSRCFIWWWNTASHVWYITSSVVLRGRGNQKSESCLPVGTVYLGVSRIYVYDQDCSLTVKCTFAINRKLIFFLFFVRWGGRRFWRRYVTVRGLWYSFMCKYLNYCTMNLVLNHFQPQQVDYVQ